MADLKPIGPSNLQNPKEYRRVPTPNPAVLDSSDVLHKNPARFLHAVEKPTRPAFAQTAAGQRDSPHPGSRPGQPSTRQARGKSRHCFGRAA